MSFTLVVLAAGLGARFGGAKQLVPVGPAGEKLLDYAVYDALRAGADKVVFVIRRELEQEFHHQVGWAYTRRLEVAYAFQELDALPAGFTVPAGRTRPWGTGHAVLAAAAQVHGPFITVNADDFYGAAGFRRLAEFLAQPSPPGPDRFALVAFELANTLSGHGAVSRGVCRVNPAGDLAGVDETAGLAATPDGWVAGADGRRLAPTTPVSLNLWGFTPALFPALEEAFVRFLEASGDDPKAELFLPTVVTDLISAGRAKVAVLPTGERWWGVTYREDAPAVTAALADACRRGAYPSPLWSPL